MFAYGGGASAEKSLASNAISFNMGADGRAILTPSHDGQASGPGQKIIDLPQGTGHARPKLCLQNALTVRLQKAISSKNI